MQEPFTHLRFTITMPDGSAFDAWIENEYRAERLMVQLIERAECEAYSEGTNLN